MLKIYEVYRNDGDQDYDEAVAFVVIAASEAAARELASERHGDEGKALWYTDRVKVNEIGTANFNQTPAVIVRDFRAG